MEISADGFPLITLGIAFLETSSDSYRWTDHVLWLEFLIGILGMVVWFIFLPFTFIAPLTLSLWFIIMSQGGEFLFVPDVCLSFDSWTSPSGFLRHISNKIFQYFDLIFLHKCPFSWLLKSAPLKLPNLDAAVIAKIQSIGYSWTPFICPLLAPVLCRRWTFLLKTLFFITLRWIYIHPAENLEKLKNIKGKLSTISSFQLLTF